MKLLPSVPLGFEGYEFAITEDMVNQLKQDYPYIDSVEKLLNHERYCAERNYPKSLERAIYIRNRKIDMILE